MSVTTTAPPQKARTTAQNIGLILSFIVLGGILLLPTPETLSTGGHRMIGVAISGTSRASPAASV